MPSPRYSSRTKSKLAPRAKEEEQSHKINNYSETEDQENENHDADSPPQELSANALISGMINPRGVSPQSILAMQSTFGNRAVQRAILQSKTSSSGEVQRVLGVAQPTPKRAHSNAIIKKLPETFQEVLNNPNLYKYFYAFAVSEFTTENLDFIEVVKNYRNSLRTVGQAKAIYNRFVKPKSPSELNLTSPVALGISEAFKKVKSWQILKRMPVELFDEAEKEAIRNNSDTFARFRLKDNRYFRAWQLDAPIP